MMTRSVSMTALASKAPRFSLLSDLIPRGIRSYKRIAPAKFLSKDATTHMTE